MTPSIQYIGFERTACKSSYLFQRDHCQEFKSPDSVVVNSFIMRMTFSYLFKKVLCSALNFVNFHSDIHINNLTTVIEITYAIQF
jgi:hypothetical protein